MSDLFEIVGQIKEIYSRLQIATDSTERKSLLLQCDDLVQLVAQLINRQNERVRRLLEEAPSTSFFSSKNE